MAHRNAKLNVRGRLLLVERIEGGMPVADAAEMGGISRRCGYKWWGRWREEGLVGLVDRSSRPHTSPGRTSPEMERRVIEARLRLRVGPERLAYETGVPGRTVTRILRRWGIPYLRDCDPITGEVVRASKSGGTSFERFWPGSLAHMDVKKPGTRFPTAADGASTAEPTPPGGNKWAGRLFTPSWTTTPAWPTPSRSPTKEQTPSSGSSPGC